jgi:hypothetical protein
MGAVAPGSLALAVVLTALIGAGQTSMWTSRQYQYDIVTITLPKGEPERGRRAFGDLKCYVCHRVAGETNFPQPTSDLQGPDLDRSLSFRPASDVAAAIILPSHSMSVKTSAAIKTRLKDTQLSPMGDFSGTLTVRQLADLLTYLGSLQNLRR